MHEPLLLPFGGLATGIAIATWLNRQGLEGFTRSEGMYATLALAMLYWIAYRFSKSRWVKPVCLFVALTAAGVWLEAARRKGPAPVLNAASGETLILSGCVIDPPVFYEHRSRFLLEIDRKAIVQVSLYFNNDTDPAPDLHYGQRVEFEAKIRAPHNFRNAGYFDYVDYLARKDIYWTASARGDTPIAKIPGECGSRFDAAIFWIRTGALERLERLFPGDTYANGMLAAILIGETRKLDKVWTEHFRRTGTYHALVISGLHFSSLTFLLALLLRSVNAGSVPRLIAGLAVGWLYTAVSGWQPPVVRAAGGLTLFLIARVFFRDARLLNVLAATGMAYLFYDPTELFDASFQLSFACVAAIGAFVEPIARVSSGKYAPAVRHLMNPWRGLHLPPAAQEFRVELRLLAETVALWTRVPQAWIAASIATVLKVAYFFYDIVVTSTVMQIALALPMLMYFHRFSASGLTANMAIIPLMSIVVPFGILAIASGWQWAAAVANSMLRWSEAVAAWHLKWAPEFRVPDPPNWLAFTFGAALLICAISLRKARFRWVAVPVALAAFGTLSFVRLPPALEAGKFELTAIDVGQGDSLFAAFPRGQLMLVDAGGIIGFANNKVKRRPPQIDIGEDVVSTFLWARRVDRLDVVVSSHAHDDHIGGLPAVIANFHPRELWTGANPPSEAWAKVEAAAHAAGTRIRSFHNGEKFEFSGTTIEVLAPLADYLPADVPKNNDSLAFMIEYGKHRFLLTGDMEQAVELQLAFGDRPLPRIDVLKVAHHGSKTSSTAEFLDRTRPSFALISDGIDNLFHHPHPSVIARLDERHIATLRTDLEGMLTVISDGKMLTYSTGATSLPIPVR
jgi:competence protein ComEC